MMGAINGADDGNGPGTHGLALFFVGVRIVQIFIIFCCFTLARIHNRNNNTHLSIIRMGIVCSGPINQ
jgi:hypothetical protein